MKSLMLFLAIGLAASEKLDRTYLPPPGSKFAGGEPGDLQVPLEFPKESYTTTSSFIPGHKEDEPSSFDNTRLVPGTQRTGIDFPRTSTEIVPVTLSNKPLFNLYQTKVPTTTTSYAFTQTTTFPTTEGFETTPSPVFSGDGPLGDQTFIAQQPFNQGSIYNQQRGQTFPELPQPGNQILQNPGFFSPAGTNIYGGQTSAPGDQFINGRPSYSQAQNNNQYPLGVPVSTISPIPGSSFQPELMTSSPYDQGYIQHLGVQPPRQFIQQGSTPSTTAAPGYQTIFPSQYNDNVANIQGTKFIEQPTVSPTSGPQQSTTQNFDKYGNVQNTVVPGFIVPQQIQPGQSHLPQTSLTQYSGDIDSIPRISSSVISPQGSPISTNVPQGITTTGITPGQRTENTLYSGQQGAYQTSSLPQGSNAPRIQQKQQYEGNQGAYLPTTSSKGLITSGQRYQQPQSVLQQSNFPTATFQPEFGSQGLSPDIAPQQQLGGQQPNIIGQQGLFPSNIVPGQGPINQESGIPQIIGQQGTFLPGQITYQQPQSVKQQGINSPGQITYQQIGKQPQIIGQQGILPGQTIYQQPGNLPQIIGQQGLYPSTSVPKPPQFIGQQGSIIPSQTTYQQPGIQQPQLVSQQRPISSAINNQGSTISGQNNFQQPQTFPTTGIPNIDLSNPTDTESIITQGSPVQQTMIGNLPSTEPFGQPQEARGRVPPQQNFTPRPGQQNVFTGSPQNIYGTGSTSLPPVFQQPSSASTTPSSGARYGMTPESNYPSSTPSYPGAELGNVYSSEIKPRPERPQAESDRNAVIINYENVLTPEGYAYTFDTSNGIHADENGTAIDGVRADGSYSYVGDDGKLYSVVYTADEHGFRPHGDHLPTPPPIPKAIQKVIEQAAKDREAGIAHDGFYDEAKYGHHKYQKPKHRHPKPDNNITNGAVIPDNNESRDDERKHDEFVSNKYLTEDDEGSLAENDEMRTDSGNGRPLINTGIKMQNQSDRKHLSRGPSKKPGKIQYENNIHKDHLTNVSAKPHKHLSGQKNHDRESYTSSQDSVRRHPDRKGEPISVQKNKEHERESYDEESVNSSKVSGNKYPVFEENDQRVGSPGYFDSKQQNMRRIPQGSNKQSTSNLPIKPISGSSKSFEMKYKVSKSRPEEKENYAETYMPNEKDQRIVSRPTGENKKGSSNNRNQFTYKQKPSSDTQYNTDNINYPMGTRYEQNFKPSNEENAEQNEDEETGYQYTPPETKFEQNTSKFPSRFSEKVTPSFIHETSDKKTTIQPFITPNVHRGEDESYEDNLEENVYSKESDESAEKVSTTIPEYETTDDDSSEYFDNENKPGKYSQERNVTSTNIRPAGKTGSKYRPDYLSPPTTDHYDEYVTESEGDSPSYGSTKPVQKNDGRYSLNSEKQNARGKPGQNYLQRPKGTSKSPSFKYVSSTTPMPFRKTYRPGPKEPSQQEEQFKYSTIYEPDSSSLEEDYTEDSLEPGFSTSKPNSRRPVAVSGGYYGKTIGAKVRPGLTKSSSKTTSRPSYDYLEKTGVPSSPTVRPGISESAFSRPSIRPGSTNRPGYSTTVTQTSTGSQRRPGASIIENYGNIPGSDISESNSPKEAHYPSRNQKIGQAGSQDLPSTTYRPNYTITDISQPGSSTVDTFGRPIQSTGTPGRGTTRLTFTSPGQVTSDGQSTNYEDSGATRPEQAITFKPTEPRFGSPQGTVGLKPAEFGPTSFTTPGYLSPYGPSSGKVIGEDFSGPKQPQKFDPETGYYY